VRAGPLSQPQVLKLLDPFVVTAWNGPGESAMPADVREIFSASEQSRDPKRLNVFMFVLDHEGRLVHGFHGLSGRGDGRSDYQAEITRAISKLPSAPPARLKQPRSLPDLEAAGGRAPAGVRLFVGRASERQPSKNIVVETVAMKDDQWQALSFPEKTKDLEAEVLKGWLVQMYPPAIRTVDQSKPFIKITGALQLEPAGVDQKNRYALLQGKVHLAKGDEKASAFEGTLRAVITYRLDAPEVQSVRGVVEGEYLYRIRETQRIPLVAAIESRPE
jgi:hypothetical protein